MRLLKQILRSHSDSRVRVHWFYMGEQEEETDSELCRTDVVDIRPQFRAAPHAGKDGSLRQASVLAPDFLISVLVQKLEVIFGGRMHYLEYFISSLGL